MFLYILKSRKVVSIQGLKRKEKKANRSIWVISVFCILINTFVPLPHLSLITPYSADIIRNLFIFVETLSAVEKAKGPTFPDGHQKLYHRKK